MSHQRFSSSIDGMKEPHSVSLKVLRLSRPSLVVQYPLQAPTPQPLDSQQHVPAPMSASLAFPPTSNKDNDQSNDDGDAFILSPIVNLPASFGSTYVGETFTCTLCANNEILPPTESVADDKEPPHKKKIRDVRIDAEMKTPSAGTVHKLENISPKEPSASTTQSSSPNPGSDTEDHSADSERTGTDLAPGETLQRIVKFHLKEKGNHVLAVTVSYYEATETSGRTRTFRKLYQFICKPALVVRTKSTALTAVAAAPPADGGAQHKWVLEAQLENCSETPLQLEKVLLDPEPGLACQDLNWPWPAAADVSDTIDRPKPVLHPGEVEQVCFVLSQDAGTAKDGEASVIKDHADGKRVTFGIMSVGWRGEMGSVGFLSTGRLGARVGG